MRIHIYVFAHPYSETGYRFSVLGIGIDSQTVPGIVYAVGDGVFSVHAFKKLLVVALCVKADASRISENFAKLFNIRRQGKFLFPVYYNFFGGYVYSKVFAFKQGIAFEKSEHNLVLPFHINTFGWAYFPCDPST